MAKSSTYWDKRALQRLSEAEKSSEVYIKRIKKIYEKAYKDINREIANVYKNYSKDTGLDVEKLKELLTRSETAKFWEQMKRQGLDKYIKNNYKARISRLEQIQAQIYAKAKQIYPKEELEQTMCYKGVINNSYYKTVYDTQMGTGYNFTFSKIDKNMLNSLLNERWSGKNYSQRIWANTDILAESLSEILGGGLLSGQSIAKTSKQVRERFNVSQYYAERLVRTETNHFNNTADAMAYEEMGIDKYVFVATLDERTSEKCQDMDGKKFAYKDKQEGVNFPPLHPNCRSKTRGYIDEETEKSLKRRAKNLKTGKTEIIDNITYKEWAEKNGIVKKQPTKKTVKTDKKVKNVAKPVNIVYEENANLKSNYLDWYDKLLGDNASDKALDYAQSILEYSEENVPIELNKYLRKEKYNEDIFENMFTTPNEMSENISKGISLFNLDKNIMVHRGTDLKEIIGDVNITNIDILNKDFVDTSYINKSFTSTSLSTDIATIFARDNNIECVVDIRVPKESKCAYLGGTAVTDDPKEKELLIDKNTKFKIIKFTKDKFDIIHVLTEIVNQFD